MIKRTKLWTTISAATVAGIATASISGCDSSTDDNSETTLKADVSISEPVKPLAYEGEGEGEGGAADLSIDDIAYLTQLALMRGHLFVGNELYKAGHIDHAKMHMKHPESELYADLVPALDVRGATGFADQLSALSDAVESNAEADTVANAYSNISDVITKSEEHVDQASLSPDRRLKLVSEILRIAGEEYAIAVVDGKMQNAHEYQDALGFTTIAKTIVESINSGDRDVTSAKEQAIEYINSLDAHWPSMIPPSALDTDASALYVAAAKIELLSLGIR